ncbi:F-box domain [Lasallia pustulata]|uniref:F-box domain n=1 Tax=Lasallia pustulata TaxID=136370 RepID=A0A1W5CV16_9LECA|nr:F-box domain [Lasallia pustulata]
MALDADRNLAAEKEESFIKWLQKGLESKKAQTPNTKKIHQQFETSYLPSIPSKTERSCSNDAAVHLPQEIILQILSYIPRDPTSQSYLHACSLVSRSWYSATVPLLYHSPHFTGKNFRQFVATVCPSINAHIRKSELAGLVRRLDMGNLVHDGSKSLTARLLGRVKGGLEEFVAPQASFAINCLAALSKCTHLHHLDLSLISESLSLSDLFHSIGSLENLISLRFPRSSTNDTKTNALHHSWPPLLQTLHISGGLRDASLLYFCTAPPTLTSLTISNCPHLSMAFISPLLKAIGPHLTHLRISENMPQLGYAALDNLLLQLPSLLHLDLSTDFITAKFFVSASRISPAHPLNFLELSSPRQGFRYDEQEIDRISSDHIFRAIDAGGLSNLRRLRVHRALGWTDSAEARVELKELSELLEAMAREEGSGSAGVWIFNEHGTGTIR